MNSNRRSFIKKIGGTTLSSLAVSKVLAGELCNLDTTPDQPKGPFYPVFKISDTNADLTNITGNNQKAKGEIILVKGKVEDQNCKPIAGAIVEIWQACQSGKYNHPSDTSKNKLDKNFQYYASVKTNLKGEYSFKTIIPGSYNATDTWTRPPHIHFKISLRGYKELITQMYFQGVSLNRYDRILQDLNRDEQKKVIIKFKKENASDFKLGFFNIKLNKL